MESSRSLPTSGGRTAQQVRLLMKPGVWDTYVAAVNQGLPNKLIGADEALAKLEDARLKGK